MAVSKQGLKTKDIMDVLRDRASGSGTRPWRATP
eukprot:SAG22_NODE_3558_length_1642_cov_2.377187_1_plen_34_part_00